MFAKLLLRDKNNTILIKILYKMGVIEVLDDKTLEVIPAFYRENKKIKKN